MALVGLSAARPVVQNRSSAKAAEPLLSAELDHLYRSARRPANIDIGYERAEAGRILLTSSSHSGVSTEESLEAASMQRAGKGALCSEVQRNWYCRAMFRGEPQLRTLGHVLK